MYRIPSDKQPEIVSSIEIGLSPQSPQQPVRNSHSMAIRLGVCAMNKKIQAKPMQEILKRLACKHIEIIIIADEYWDKCQKTWPRVDALICFYSDGFPYTKAWKYVQLTKPFLINDLDKQQILWDRTLVYTELKKYNIPILKSYFVCRNKETMQDFYKQRNSDIDEYEAIIPIPPPVLSELTRISEKQDQEEEPEKNSSIKQRAPSIRRNQDSFYDSVEDEDEDEAEDPHFHKELEIHSPLMVPKVRRKDKVIKRCNTLVDQIPRNPVEFLRGYFKQLKYENYTIQEKDDCVFLNSHKLKKPFVEKPFDAERHDVFIYYPEIDGGGCKQLFRKKDNSCSIYDSTWNKIRTDGNYVYEEFVRTNGFDIKVYTVGPYYMHAEARKSPCLDGIVQRNEQGKEIRFPVFLTPHQKFIAQKVVQVFGQFICGFDLLRSDDKSYVCDVNGWSFVKGNMKYYDDCSAILKKLLFQRFIPTRVKQLGFMKLQFGNFNEYIHNQFKPPVEQLQGKQMELRSIVAIFRHGDRSPKQKMKVMTTDPRFLVFFKGDINEVKMKDPKTLTELLETTNIILSQNTVINELFLKLIQLKSVLEIGGHFEGFNRKVQLKAIQTEVDPIDLKKKVVKAVLILKWGGQLTKKGESDAIELGKLFRLTKYQHDQGLISLHSSYRHDLKTSSSEEGRCLKTAAAFLKGFLDLEGDLTPIIISMINRDMKAQKLLDCSSTQGENGLEQVQKIQKQSLSQKLNANAPLAESLQNLINIDEIPQSMRQIINKIGFPVPKLEKLYSRIAQLTKSLAKEASATESYYINSQDIKFQNKLKPQSQSLVLVYRRWYKLQKDLYDNKKRKYDISKIPDIYDSINYDMSHNRQVLEQMYNKCQELYEVAKELAYFVVPNEYGIKDSVKLKTAKFIVTPLCKKIYNDLMFWKDKKGLEDQQEFWKYKGLGNSNKEWRHVRTRLYFTSSSHMYSVFNLLTLGKDGQILKNCPQDIAKKIKNSIYLGYLAHIEFRLYENLSASDKDPKRFRLSLSMNPYFSKNQPIQAIDFKQQGFTIEEIQDFFESVLQQKITSDDS